MDISLDAPDLTSLSRLSKGLNPKLEAIQSKQPTLLIIDCKIQNRLLVLGRPRSVAITG